MCLLLQAARLPSVCVLRCAAECACACLRPAAPSLSNPLANPSLSLSFLVCADITPVMFCASLIPGAWDRQYADRLRELASRSTAADLL